MSIYVTSRASMINRFKHKIKVINESGKTVHVTLIAPFIQRIYDEILELQKDKIIYNKEELDNDEYISVSYYKILKIQIYYKNKEIFHGHLNEGEILTILAVDESDEYEPRRLEIYNNLKKNQKRDLYIIFIIYVIFFIIIYSNKDKI
jgi:hypothetical protein